MKKYLFLGFIVLSVIFVSCASGSAIVTGNARMPIEPNAVKIYSEFPAKYEVIAIVKASSDAGFSEQGDYNYAIAELKKQAAKVGANGVVIESLGESTSGYVYNYGVAVPISEHSVVGKAIFVEE